MIRVETVTCQLATHNPADGMNEVSVVEIFKPILIGVMDVGLVVEFMSQGILNPIFIMSILEIIRTRAMMETRDSLNTPLCCT